MMWSGTGFTLGRARAPRLSTFRSALTIVRAAGTSSGSVPRWAAREKQPLILFMFLLM